MGAIGTILRDDSANGHPNRVDDKKPAVSGNERGETTEWVSRKAEKGDGSWDAKSGVTAARFGIARVDAETEIPTLTSHSGRGMLKDEQHPWCGRS